MIRSLSPPAARPEWAYFLDVDGTLIEIADRPDAVQVDSPLLDLMTRMTKASGGAVALLSGRAISDLRRRLAGVPLSLAGQHGMEFCDASGRLRTRAATPAAKDRIKEALKPVLARHPQLLLEDKGLTLALHYRAAPMLGPYASRLMTSLAGTGLQVQKGKRVVEIKPAGFDKGTALAEFLMKAPFKGRRPVFIGDDLADEHGFATVNELGGVSIKVGKGKTCARFGLPDVAAVRHWLGGALGARHA